MRQLDYTVTVMGKEESRVISIVLANAQRRKELPGHHASSSGLLSVCLSLLSHAFMAMLSSPVEEES